MRRAGSDVGPFFERPTLKRNVILGLVPRIY
jgi:hypothetical protein